MTKTWSTMSNAEKVALGTTLAGVNQYKVFSAVMNNFDQAINATNESFESSGATLRQNAVYMESLEAKVTALKAEFEKFVLGDGGLQDFAKITVSMTTSILSLVNTLGGLKSVLTVIVGILATVKIEAIYSSIIKVTSGAGSLITTIANIGSALISSKGNVQAFDIALKGLGISASVAEIAMGALTVAISGIVIAYNTMQQAKEESLRASKDTITSNEQELESLESLINQVENEKITREQLFDVIKNSTISGYEEEISKMEDVNEMRQAVIDKIYEEAKAKAENTVRETGSEYSKQKDFLGGSYTIDRLGNFETPKKALEELEKRIDSFNVKLQNGEKLTTSEQNALNALTAEYTNLKTKVEDAETVVNGYEDASELLNQTEEEWLDKATEKQDALDGINEIDKEFIDTIKEVNELTEEQSQQLDEAIAKWIEEGNAIDDFDFDGFISGLDDATNSTNNAVDATERLTQAQKDLDTAMSNLSNMSSNYDTLTSAMNEYNNSGNITLDTLAKLTALGSDWVSLLQVENGQMSINEQGLVNLANAYIDDAEAKAYEKAMAELNAAAQNQETTAKKAGTQASSASVTASTNAGNAAKTSGENAYRAASQWNQFWQQVSKNEYKGKVDSSVFNSIVNTLKTTLNTLENARSAIGKNTKAISSSTSATKSNSGAKSGNTKATKDNTSAVDANTEALKANIEALKKQKEQLEKDIEEDEKVISIIKDALDKEIEKLKELRDAEKEAIEEQREELKKYYEEEVEELDKLINAREEEKKASEDYYNEEINKLKEKNEVLEDQIELEKLLQNLENAKNKKTRVYRKGKGFVYETDQDEVNKAQKELDEYYRKKALSDQIKQLENARDAKSKIYDEEIELLKKYKKDAEEQYKLIDKSLEKQLTEIDKKYDEDIDKLTKLKEEFVKMTTAYQDELNKQLVKQKAGIDLESQGWTDRLKNLQSFIDGYNQKLGQLQNVSNQLNVLEAQYDSIYAKQQAIIEQQSKVGSGSSGGGSSSGGTTQKMKYDYLLLADIKGTYNTKESAKEDMGKRGLTKDYDLIQAPDKKWYIFKKDYKYGFTETNHSNALSKIGNVKSKWASQGMKTSLVGDPIISKGYYATGVSSVGENQYAVVGDSPTNRELVIGSHLNGTPIQLQKGSGVVNAKSTNTLAGLLNHLGAFNGSNFGAGNGILSNTSNSEAMYIDKVVIEGSNITDVVSFKNSLMNLKSEATQRAYRHK